MLPLIKSSGKGRVVNVSSGYGNLKYPSYLLYLFLKFIVLLFMTVNRCLSPYYRQLLAKPDLTISDLVQQERN